MKLPALSVVFTALVAGTTAQGLADLPQCAQQCATKAIPKECGLDIKCICSTASFIGSISCCVAQACDPEDQTKTIQFANSICDTAGVTTLPQSAACTAASATATGTATSGVTSSMTSSMTSSTASSSASSTSSGSASAASPSGSSAAAPIAQSQNRDVVASVGAAAIFVAMFLA